MTTVAVPKLTTTGTKRLILDEALFQEIQEYYRSNAKSPEEANQYISASKANQRPTSLTELHQSMKDKLHSTLQPICTEWTNRKLRPTYVYGIRTYHDGAILKVHVDRPTTHMVSAIINIDQKVRKPWPLLIQGEAGDLQAWKQVFLAPGEVLLYEGHRLAHGRPNAFEGDFFANVFVHYALA